MYRISCGMNCNRENACVIELDDQTFFRLSSGEWYKVISEGLRCMGYVDSQEFTIVTIRRLGYKAECHRQNNRCAVTSQTVETIGILGNEACTEMVEKNRAL